MVLALGSTPKGVICWTLSTALGSGWDRFHILGYVQHTNCEYLPGHSAVCHRVTRITTRESSTEVNACKP